jgi:mono/diheme cytochrome c family protein
VKLLVVVPILLAMILLRWVRPNMLVWTLSWTLALYLFLRHGFATPVPTSVIRLYMCIAVLALFAYVTSSRKRIQDTVGPIIRLAVEPGYTWALVLIVLAIPALVAFNVYYDLNRPLLAPTVGYTIHPAPPDSITVHDQTVNLITADNPLRKLETSDPDEFRRRVDNGRKIYYRSCHYCHGTDLAGNGLFARGLYPLPTNFTDPGTIAELQESFLFWRIAKGGPGLPSEAGPWDSSMPAWEEFLSVDEIWEATLALYDLTGHRPRAVEAEAHQ